MTIDPKIRNKLRAAIAGSFLTTQHPSFKNLQKDFSPHMSDATFWREVKAVRQVLIEGQDPEGFNEPTEAQAKFSKIIEDVRGPNVEDDFGHSIPHQLSATFLELLSDAEKLKAAALDRAGNITNPVALAESVKLRIKLINMSENVIDRLYEITRVTDFFRALGYMLRELPEPVKSQTLELLDQFTKAAFTEKTPQPLRKRGPN